MRREYWFILITYIAMQLSSFIGVPIMSSIAPLFGKSGEELATFSISTWLIISFSTALLIILFLLRKEMAHPVRSEKPLSPVLSTYWTIGGIFLAFMAQTVAANIEFFLGIEMRSENTEQIVDLIRTAPIIVIVTTIMGPILEEIVFRKIIFGTLYIRLNFFLAAIISSLIFAIAHGEPEHIILYSSIGLTFAYLYVKTKRIIVPIIAHVTMNTVVVLMQLNTELVTQL